MKEKKERENNELKEGRDQKKRKEKKKGEGWFSKNCCLIVDTCGKRPKED